MQGILKKELEKYQNIDKTVKNYWSLESCQGIRYLNLILGLFPIYNYKTVIDVGCGPGHLLNYLNKKNYAVCGIDPTVDKIEKFYDHIPIDYATCDDIPYESNSTDLVLCTDVLEHIPEELIDNSLQELGRVAKKGLFLTISLTDSIHTYNGETLHVTIKTRRWWLDKISQNIKGYIIDLGLSPDILIVRVDKNKFKSVDKSLLPLNLLSEAFKNYEFSQNFYEIRNSLIISNYNNYKSLGFKNFLNIKEKFDKILLVGAGHNISKSFQLIKKMQQEGYSIWCCNHIVSGLLKNKIDPDYVICTETREVLMHTLCTEQTEEYVYKNLVLHAACHPRAFTDLSIENKFIYFSEDSDSKTLSEFYNVIKEKTVTPYSTVSCFMFALALKMNPKDLKIIGYDFTTTDDLPYDKNVPFLNDTEKGKIIYTLKEPIEDSTDGVKYKTTRVYRDYASQVGTIIARIKLFYSNINFERLGYSPIMFDTPSEAFLNEFGEFTGYEFEDFLKNYTLVDMFNRKWKKKLSLDVKHWKYYLIPIKILRTDLRKYSVKNLKFIKERFLKLYDEGLVID